MLATTEPATRHYRTRPKQMPTIGFHVCWFCDRKIVSKRDYNLHHLLPKRYWRHAEYYESLVRAHFHCHMKWHQQFDNGSASLVEYQRIAKSWGWGQGIFKKKQFRRYKIAQVQGNLPAAATVPRIIFPHRHRPRAAA
jgi:hypothetical protein